jgi:hypothetical protein
MNYVFYYKISCLIVGLIISYLGYRLFVAGIFDKAGDLHSSWKDFKLVITKAAPGLYFVVLGTIIICTTIYKGYSLDEYRPGITKPPSEITTPSLDSIPRLKNDSTSLKTP